jgi:hypothetical protein
MHRVHDRLEQRKTLRWQADTSPDHDTGIMYRSQVTFYRLASPFIRTDEAQIGLPSPICHLLLPEREARACDCLSDGDFALVLANAAHVKNVPGRKTDLNDATWLADLLTHGLICGSFVPVSKPRRCATCCAPASSWCGSAAGISSGCKGAGRRRHQARLGHLRCDGPVWPKDDRSLDPHGMSACVILAEIGRDMSRFPTAGHPGFRRGRLVWGLGCQGPSFDQSRP